MIQDIAPKKLYNAYDPSAVPDEDSFIFHIRGPEAALFIKDGEVSVPRLRDCRPSVPSATAGSLQGSPESGPGQEEYTYLFSIDQDRYFLAPPEAEIPEGCVMAGIRGLRNGYSIARDTAFAAYTALQLAGWYRDNRFCGTCGSKTVHDTVERAVRCPACGRVIYPRIIPAVIVGVINGDTILLTKYNRNRGVSFYALIAGFTEIGETLEETVAREVMEEAGLRVKNIRYYKSQPWGIADDILAGFYCDVDGSTEISLDRSELREGLWVPRKEVTLQPNDYSLTNEMMLRFREGRENER